MKKLYFLIIFVMYSSPIFANDFYSKFHQTDYKVEFQRAELIHYNKSVLNFMEIKTFKYNRTLPVMNITLNSKVDMSTEVEVGVQTFKFLSNEYRKLPGTYFQVNFCKSFHANIAGSQNLLKCGNATSCHLLKETTYRICNLYIDETKFPPFVPNGEYKHQLDFIYKDEIVAAAAAYLKIYRPIPIPKKRQTG